MVGKNELKKIRQTVYLNLIRIFPRGDFGGSNSVNLFSQADIQKGAETRETFGCGLESFHKVVRFAGLGFFSFLDIEGGGGFQSQSQRDL